MARELQNILSSGEVTEVKIGGSAAEDAAAKIADLDAHEADSNNPHSVTKAQVGLDQVDNTSDADKPVSTAQQAALDLKADLTYVDTELSKKQNIATFTADIDAHLVSGNIPNGGIMLGGTNTLVNKVPNLGDLNADGMMQWQGKWAQGNSYSKNMVVLDGSWTMIANKDTTERPAPQPLGDPVDDQTVEPTFNTNNFTGVVHSGHTYTFTKAGWIKEVSAYVPQLTGDTNYRFIFTDLTDPANPSVRIIEEPVLVEDGWATIALGESIVTAGTKFRIVCDALNSGGTTPVTGGWAYGGSSGTAPVPAAGGWSKDTNNNILRIDKTDLDLTDRTSELLGMIPGTEIQMAETAIPGNNMNFNVEATPVDAGTYVEYQVTLLNTSGTVDAGDICTMTALVPVAQPTQYVQEAGYWGVNPCPFATAEGYLTQNGVEQTVPDDVFGVRITFQEASVSEDWELVSYGGFGGGSAGQSGGAGTQGVRPRFALTTIDLGLVLTKVEIVAALAQTGFGALNGETFYLSDGNNIFTVLHINGEYYYERLSHAS